MRKIGSLMNVQSDINNLITLFNGNNDVYDGILSYIYFRVLNMNPIEYFNIEDEDEIYSESERQSIQEEFEKFGKLELTQEIKEEMEEIIVLVREKALKEKVLSKFGEYCLIEKHNQFQCDYIIKEIFRYYNLKKMKEIEEW